MNPDYTLKNIIFDNKYFFVPYMAFLISGLFEFYFGSHASVLLFINSLHNNYLDFFFSYVTYLGDGISSIIVALILIFVRYRYSMFVILSYITGGLFAQLIKNFAQTPRPKLYFEHSSIALNYVPGVDLLMFNSFPSGHSASAFSLFLTIAIITKNKLLGIAFFFCALIVAASRIYLLQHFFVDVYFGSIIGVFFALLTIVAMNHIYKISSSEILNTSLRTKIN